jgi:hypothetical protein
MNPTRKMWISAGVVGVILVGGASVAAVASAGRIDQARMERASETERQEGLPFSQPSGTPDPAFVAPDPATGGHTPDDRPHANDPTQKPEDFVVSHEFDPTSPGDVADYWTRERMEQAEPMPMPVVTGDPTG